MGSVRTFAESVSKVGLGPAATDRPDFSELHRLRDSECISELDAEVAHSAIHLRMAEQ